jgi:hypothetical protein
MVPLGLCIIRGDLGNQLLIPVFRFLELSI